MRAALNSPSGKGSKTLRNMEQPTSRAENCSSMMKHEMILFPPGVFLAEFWEYALLAETNFDF